MKARAPCTPWCCVAFVGGPRRAWEPTALTLISLSAATALEADPVIKNKIEASQVKTVISWGSYSVIYLFLLLGIKATSAVVPIQVDYDYDYYSKRNGRYKVSSSECLHLEPFMLAALALYGPLWRSVRG